MKRTLLFVCKRISKATEFASGGTPQEEFISYSNASSAKSSQVRFLADEMGKSSRLAASEEYDLFSDL